MPSITFQPLQRHSPAELVAFSQLNQGLICEMNTNGSIVLKTPESKKYNRLIEKIQMALDTWNNKDENGIVLDMKTGFVLPNGAIRHPALSWIKLYKKNAQHEHLIESAPDFVIEMLSETNSFDPMRIRMREYLLNGALLGWLIDIHNEKVYIFKNDGTETIYDKSIDLLKGDLLLKGFEIHLF